MVSLRVLFWRVMIYGMASTDLGERIRRLREAQRLDGQPWTQAYLASRVGVSERTIGRWEREGTVPRSSIGALEKLFGVPLTDKIDAHEAEYRARLAGLQADEFMTAPEAAEALKRYQERRRRAAGNGTAERIS